MNNLFQENNTPGEKFRAGQAVAKFCRGKSRI